MKPVQGAALPQRDRRIYWIEPVNKGGEVQDWLIYSPNIWGIWTHFHEGTFPCYENHKHCHLGHDSRTLRWKGYLFGFFPRKSKPCFLQLTPASAEALLEQVPEGQNLRGLRIKVSRTDSKKGRLRISIDHYGAPVDPTKMIKDQDPRFSLFNAWKIDDPGHRFAINPNRAKIFKAETGDLDTVLRQSEVS